MYYKIAQLILTPSQQATSTNEVFVAQPDAYKESLAGKLFVLIEIESKKAEDLKIINFLINTINHNYYQNEKIILRERISTLKVEHIFESALAKTNKKLAEFLQSEKIKFNHRILNITIGVLYKDLLYFTNLGKNKALLIYKNKTKPINTSLIKNSGIISNEIKYKLVDIIGQTDNNESRKQINITKLFSNITSGSIPQGGYFIFTSETLPEYLSNKQIIDIITVLPPAGAIEQIKTILTKINAYVSFSAILIKNTSGLENYEQKKQIIEQPTTQTSIKNFNAVEEKTEKLLISPGLISLGRWQIVLTKIIDTIKSKYPLTINNNKLFLLKDKIFLKKRPSWLFVKKIIALIKNIFLYLINLFVFIFKTITNKERLEKSLTIGKQKIIQIIITVKQLISMSVAWFKCLNKKGRVLLLISIACLFLFIINLSWSNLKNRQSANLADYTNLIKSIEQKQNQIDASLIYNNVEGAKTILTEIKELIATLPRNNAEQKKQYNEISQKNMIQLEKISKVIRVNAPTELANFSNLNSNAKPINIILSKGKIYAADIEQKTIYSLELTDNLSTAIVDANKIISQLNYPSLDKDNNIYYLNPKSAIRLDRKTESLTNLIVEYNGDFQQFIDSKIFNNRLYCLSPKNNQIIRFNKTSDKFTGAINWLNNNIDLTGAISIDIDGTIYVLKNNGELSKFIKGKKEDFSLEAIEPTLTHAAKVVVSREQKYIYILDTVDKRLVVFDKSGKLINQYVSEKFNDLKDFTIDETNKKIYFLNNASILEIKLEIVARQ
ncbi:MAG: hypothetical protein V1649_01580 [Patescibacteria group bacterium]